MKLNIVSLIYTSLADTRLIVFVRLSFEIRSVLIVESRETGWLSNWSQSTNQKVVSVTTDQSQVCIITSDKVDHGVHRRLLSQYCHLQKCLKHPGRLQRIHPGGLELYHLTNDLVSQHPGQLRSPWYLGCVTSAARKWSCCKVRN